MEVVHLANHNSHEPVRTEGHCAFTVERLEADRARIGIDCRATIAIVQRHRENLVNASRSRYKPVANARKASELTNSAHTSRCTNSHTGPIIESHMITASVWAWELASVHRALDPASAPDCRASARRWETVHR